MQTFKWNLTHIKTLINQHLPEVGDIYDYPGVSRESLCAAIDIAYSLSQEIKPDDETLFAVISLKRAGKATYDKLKSILETDEEDKKRKRFDEFLDSLAYLLEKTKITYFIVVKGGLRTDSELADIRNRIAALAPLEAELGAKVSQFDEDTEGFSEAIKEFSAAHEESKKQMHDIENWHSAANGFYTGIEEVHNKVEGWDEEIGTNAAEFESLKDKISALSKEATLLNAKMQDYATQAKNASDSIAKAKEDHVAIAKQISLLLGDTNRAGMAASFLKRKDELGPPQLIWQRTFIGAILGLLVVVGGFIVPSIIEGKSVEVVGELALVSPLVWLGWFAAKQYGYTSRIREDYAFKAAAAMAYEGHKDAARHIDKHLEGVLLEFSLYNLAQNPIRLYGGLEVHASPWSEFFGKAVGKLCRLANIKVEQPKIGSAEVAFANEDGKGSDVQGK